LNGKSTWRERNGESMSDDKKQDPRHPETFFLPPLKMILSFFDRESRQREKKKKDAEKQEEAVEKNVEKLIEKLSEKEK
jgi:hypothetical protein